MKVAVIGGTESALELATLLKKQGLGPAVVVLQPPDVHEDKTAYANTLAFVEKHAIPHLVTKKFSSDVAQLLLENNIDVGCLINCRFLIPEKYLDCLSAGFVAAHGSLLPEYRGFAPLNWTILNKKNEIGITLFRAAASVDSGAILLTKSFAITPATNASEIFKLFVQHQPQMFVEVLRKYQNLGSFEAWQVPQNEGLASYGCRRTPVDSEIEWTKSADEIQILVRASQAPYPNAFTFFRGEYLRIVECSIPNPRKRFVGSVPGRVIEISGSDGWIEVLAGDGPIRIEKVIYRDQLVVPAQMVKSLKETLGLNYSQEIISLRAEIEQLKRVVLTIKI